MSGFRRRLVAIGVSALLATGAALTAITSPAAAAAPPLAASGVTQSALKAAGVRTASATASYLLTEFGKTGGAYGGYTVSYNGCTTLTKWYVGVFTTFAYGGGNGGDVAAKLVSANPNRGLSITHTPAAGAIFSSRDSAWGATQMCGTTKCGHTGLVVGVNGNQVEIVETNSSLKGTSPYAKSRTITWYSTQQVDFVWVGGPAGSNAPPPGGSPALGDGSIVRTPDGAIWVIAGGAKYHLSGPEYALLGSPGYVSVTPESLNAYGLVPTNTFLRNPVDGKIYQVVGGFRYWLDAAEYAALGRPAAVNVPVGFIARANRTAPVGVAFLRDPVSTRIYQVIGGVKYWLSAAEYAALGSPAWIGTPAGLVATIPDGGALAGVWFLRDPVSTKIYEVIGGVKYWLNATEYANLGSPAWTGAAAGFINRIPDAGVPQGSWYLRDPVSQAIYQVTGGTKYWLNATEYADLGRPAWIGAPAGLLNRIPNRP